MPVVGLACCWTLAGVFATAVFGKARTAGGRRAFRRTLTELVGLPDRSVAVAASGTVIAEGLTALLLVVPGTHTIGAATAALLLLAFTAVLVRAALAGQSTPCNCFGPRPTHTGWPGVVRNVALLATAALALWLAPDMTRMTVLEILTATAIAGAGTVTVVVWDLAIEILVPRQSDAH